MQASSGPSGEALLAIAALAAIQLTAGKSDAQAAVLGAFFTMLGDAIGLLPVSYTHLDVYKRQLY